MTALLLAALLLPAARAAAPGPEVLLRRSGVLWGFDFLPDGRVVLTERAGALLLFDPASGRVQEVSGAPAVAAKGQGGLLDVRLHPRFRENGLLYLTYAKPVPGGAVTALGRGRLEGARLTAFRELFAARVGTEGGIHFGSRLEWSGGFLFMTVGERNRRDEAQSLASHAGKILRLDEDGAPAPGNPFAGRPGALPEIWTLGHRNPQGLAVDPATGALWSAEFGPRGGDELNRVERGANYGWPVVSFGREYYGPRIGEGTEKPGMAAPALHWEPSISPSGLAFHRGAAYLACLSGRHLRRVAFAAGRPGAQEALLEDGGWRIRMVRPGPDGALYFSTDSGEFARLAAPGGETRMENLHLFEAKANDGKVRKLSDYKGKVVLVVNTASKCGYTPQYKGLEALYRKYKDRGFMVAAFPANEFGAQEPGTDAEIRSFCDLRYKTTFDLYAKVVVKGAGIHPLFAYLTERSPFPGEIPWNFTKFLIGKDGAVAGRFEPDDEPTGGALEAAVEGLLARP